MEKHLLEKSLQQQSNPAQPNLNTYKSGTLQKVVLVERAFGASHAAKNIIKLMSSDFNDEQLEAILQAHLSALETAVQYELLAEELQPEKEVL